MPFKFNPFSGNFDQTGSGGGGGASYIDGEVQNFSALPETLGSPAVDSAYLCREPEGTWLLNRKPAGIYIRTANTGTRANDWTYAGEFPDVFNDANFVLYDNGDSTKNLQFQLSGIDTATTRTLTVPNASGTIARTEDFAAPPAIGNTTPNSGAFTTLNATGETELVNGTSAAGPFRVYNTSSSANANFERGFMRWSSNNLEIGTEGAGTGTQNRQIHLKPGSNTTTNVIITSGQIIMQTANLNMGNGNNIISGSATGCKIGSATSQKFAFWNATPVVQPTAIADATDAASTQDRLNDLLATMRTLGLIAT